MSRSRGVRRMNSQTSYPESRGRQQIDTTRCGFARLERVNGRFRVGAMHDFEDEDLSCR